MRILSLSLLCNFLSLEKLSSMATPAQSHNLCEVLAESRRIIKSGHFLALSVLFLLPLSFSSIIYLTLQSNVTPTLNLLYALFVFFFSLCSAGTITYSTYHGFYGTPVDLSSAIKSLLHSFIPLASTMLASQILLVLIFLLFAVFAGLVIKLAQILGFTIDYTSVVFLVVVSVILLAVAVVFQVNYGLASVIAVVESKWGFEPLRRSANLVRGMRMVSFGLLVFFNVLSWLFYWGYWMSTAKAIRVSGWKSWSFVLQAVVGSSFQAMIMLHYLAANTVLFLYCKESHGGVAAVVAGESDRDYVSLSLDDDKLPPAPAEV